MTPDAPDTPPRRRRATAVRAAIFDAVIAELVDNGYSGLTIERVATRAHTSRSSVYRHWPTKEQLVIDTIHQALPPIENPPFADNVRDDFLHMLRAIAALAATPAGLAINGLLAEAHRHPGVAAAVFDQIIEPRQQIMLESLRRAATRREISPTAVTLLPVQVAVGVTTLHHLQFGTPPTDHELTHIIDHAILPILGLAPNRQ
ncbi:TetR/AcrR family transcriptional regulator [Nocardia araoensis]|uniref:TetR/AcrR family transcriptional regulator n=1 Tax=Nocardia araoensis TaxID=228600 RepID=UPI0002F7EC93|nr:TetR/AcrR family transcriptional regulator [Nocardia araoensis]